MKCQKRRRRPQQTSSPDLHLQRRAVEAWECPATTRANSISEIGIAVITTAVLRRFATNQIRNGNKQRGTIAGRTGWKPDERLQSALTLLGEEESSLYSDWRVLTSLPLNPGVWHQLVSTFKITRESKFGLLKYLFWNRDINIWQVFIIKTCYVITTKCMQQWQSKQSLNAQKLS